MLLLWACPVILFIYLMLVKHSHSSVLKNISYFVFLPLGINNLTKYFGWLLARKIFLLKKEYPVLSFFMIVGTYTTLPINFLDLKLGWCFMVTNSCTDGARSSYSANINLGDSTSVTETVGPCGTDKLGVVYFISL